MNPTDPTLRTPLFTDAAAHAAGIDIVPSPTELLDAAQAVIDLWGDRGADPDNPTEMAADYGSQVARTIPLLLNRIAELEAERHTTRDRIHRLENDLTGANLSTHEEEQEARRLGAQATQLRAALNQLATAMRQGQHWRGNRLVSERTLSQAEIRHLTGIPLIPHATPRLCGADLGTTTYPFNCQREYLHHGICSQYPDAPAQVVPARQQEDPHTSPLHTAYAECRDLPANP
ncbi:hypothetical protein [Streptomyces hydrogenans]|uniref:hypothetical protein n=1 Tax=Streptomyces hydrogenans TaxID=1873719 RepID=UPI0036E08658